jgi:hypothetical protein
VRYESLVGRCHGGAYLCQDWELRVTKRCMMEDLGVVDDAPFESFRDVEIVKALISDRPLIDTRQVSPLMCKQEVWVLPRGNDHRGATVFDDVEKVVWLVAAGLHRSGEPNDFFPYCKEIDADRRLLPTADDYETLIIERDARIIEAIVVEAPLILDEARAAEGEIRVEIARREVALSIEVAAELEAITVAFDLERVEFDLFSV